MGLVRAGGTHRPGIHHASVCSRDLRGQELTREGSRLQFLDEMIDVSPVGKVPAGDTECKGLEVSEAIGRLHGGGGKSPEPGKQPSAAGWGWDWEGERWLSIWTIDYQYWLWVIIWAVGDQYGL